MMQTITREPDWGPSWLVYLVLVVHMRCNLCASIGAYKTMVSILSLFMTGRVSHQENRMHSYRRHYCFVWTASWHFYWCIGASFQNTNAVHSNAACLGLQQTFSRSSHGVIGLCRWAGIIETPGVVLWFVTLLQKTHFLPLSPPLLDLLIGP